MRSGTVAREGRKVMINLRRYQSRRNGPPAVVIQAAPRRPAGTTKGATMRGNVIALKRQLHDEVESRARSSSPSWVRSLQPETTLLLSPIQQRIATYPAQNGTHSRVVSHARTDSITIITTPLPQPSQADIRRKNAQFMNKAVSGRNPVKPPRAERGNKTVVAGWVLGALLFLLLGSSE